VGGFGVDGSKYDGCEAGGCEVDGGRYDGCEGGGSGNGAANKGGELNDAAS